MYDFELKVKVPAMYEVTYIDIEQDYDQREGAYERTVTKSNRFLTWEETRSFCFDLKPAQIRQVVEIKDMTSSMKKIFSAQTKD